MDAWLQRQWYGRFSIVSLLLMPLSWLFRLVVAARRSLFRRGAIASHAVGVPVVIVGNITVGGTGKTPLVIWLVERLRERGIRPGVVCRGYRGTSPTWPVRVSADTAPEAAGDEAVLLAQRTAVPVVAAPDRVAACRALAAEGVQVIVSDDGLQHYRLRRDVEIAVIDGSRRLGNRRLLPAGPLREPPARLREVDAVVINGGRPEDDGGSAGISMQIHAGEARRLRDGTVRDLAGFRGARVHAVAGIGNPERFFAQLAAHGLELAAHAFPDHAALAPADLEFADDAPVLMTEKDAVKCAAFADERMWVVPVTAHFDEAPAARLLAPVVRAIEAAP